ncbi:MAG: hypothetical protein PVG51_09495, partial [Desulfosarcina sp.]
LRHGENACPFNSLYWHFLDRHRDRLSANHRMGTMYRVLDRMDGDEKKKVLRQGDAYLKTIEAL